MPYKRLIPYLLLAFLVLAACNLPSALSTVTPAPQGAQALYTQAALTVAAQLTEIAQPLNPTSAAALPTQTPVQLTATPAPSGTTPPSVTPLPTQEAQPATERPRATATSVPCYLAQFVRDVTVPDGTIFGPGSPFTKTWRIKNTGTCAWDEDEVEVVYVSGDGMDGDSTSLPEDVEPGETVDISVNLVAPEEPGEYTGYWMLRSDGGRFGLGAEADKAFYVEIEVEEADDGVAYSFVTNYCAADWESDAGDLPCPGEEGDEDGFVLYLDEPEQENRPENEPALWTQPEQERDGWITGAYPAIDIYEGDHFLADIGCLDEFEDCDVIFQLNYQADGGPLKTLGEWREIYDGEITRIDIDLRSLAGQEVEFILTVLANGSSEDDAAFWLVPQIRQVP